MDIPVQLVAGLLILLATVPAAAQTVAGAAFDADIHRFSGDPDLNRLNGTAAGWLITAGTPLPRHIAFRIEASSSGTIAETETLRVDVDGRTVTVASTLSHRLRTIQALAGYTQELTPRLRIVYLAGAAFSHVERTFSTNAPDLILVYPSNPDPAGGIVRINDDFVAFAAGADLLIRLRGALAALAGIRGQSLRLEGDLSGFSVRPFAGLAWVF
jgi:hypothetical protein